LVPVIRFVLEAAGGVPPLGGQNDEHRISVAGKGVPARLVYFHRAGPMNIPFFKEMRIGAYVLKQKLLGRKRYPLVLMLEPLFRCNLACVGCGKIDYPDPILNRRLSVEECLEAVDECGAPMVAIPRADSPRHRRDRKRNRGAPEVRIAVHQRSIAGEEARSVRTFALPVLFRASGRPQGAP
jgi:hypothetical protein